MNDDPFIFKTRGGGTIDLYPVLMQGDWSTFKELTLKLNGKASERTLRRWLTTLSEERLITIRCNLADCRMKLIGLTDKALDLRKVEV